jgi:DNA-binding transcriptional LysR family regulator
VIARYRAAHPNIRIELFDALASGGLSLLREGRVDIAITAGGDLREFDVTELRNERFHLVCPRKHPFAARKSVSLSQLDGQDIIHLARNSSVRQHLEAAGISARTGALEVEHLATVAALVAQGLGVSVVPELTLFHFQRAALAAVPVRDASLRRPILLARRKGKALSVAARAMVDEITRQACTA